MTADQAEQIKKAAMKKGLSKVREGFEYGPKRRSPQGRAELLEKGNPLETDDPAGSTLAKASDDQVERELIEMVISMVRQLVRREVRTDPEQIIGVVREALSILPVSSRGIRVVLHPEDASLVRRIYEVSENELGWKIIEDPVLAREVAVF